MPGDAAASEKAKIGSFFIEVERKEEEAPNTVYRKVLEVVYWQAKKRNIKRQDILCVPIVRKARR